MTPRQAVLFFIEKVDEDVFVSHCTHRLGARAVHGHRSDLRWLGNDGTVWARDVGVTLAGGMMVLETVTEHLGAAPQSGIVLEVGEPPSSGTLAFLVAVALIGRWSGCVTTPGDPAILTSRDLSDTACSELRVRRFCGGGSQR
jgi:hypothetical protein